MRAGLTAAICMAVLAMGSAAARDLEPWRLVKDARGERFAVWPRTRPWSIEARCDGRGDFVVTYRLAGTGLSRFKPNELPLRFMDAPFDGGGNVVVLKMEIQSRQMVGRIAPSRKLVAILRARGMAFDGVQEMGEPWYFGAQPALASVAEDCLAKRKAPRR